jgi:hypothetical protein
MSKPAACGLILGRKAGRGGFGWRVRLGRPPLPRAINASRPGQDSSKHPAQRGLRSARAQPPVITTRLPSTSHVNGLSTTPVAARSSLVWIEVSMIPYGAPVSARAPTAPWYGGHVSTSFTSVRTEADRVGAAGGRHRAR